MLITSSKKHMICKMRNLRNIKKREKGKYRTFWSKNLKLIKQSMIR